MRFLLSNNDCPFHWLLLPYEIIYDIYIYIYVCFFEIVGNESLEIIKWLLKVLMNLGKLSRDFEILCDLLSLNHLCTPVWKGGIRSLSFYSDNVCFVLAI